MASPSVTPAAWPEAARPSSPNDPPPEWQEHRAVTRAVVAMLAGCSSAAPSSGPRDGMPPASTCARPTRRSRRDLSRPEALERKALLRPSGFRPPSPRAHEAPGVEELLGRTVFDGVRVGHEETLHRERGHAI